MKIRNGFVSNSSSSSFIIKGYSLSREEFRDLFKDDEDILDSVTENYWPEVEERLREIGLDGVVDYNDWENPDFYIGDVVSFDDSGMHEIDLTEVLSGKIVGEFDKRFPNHKFRAGTFGGVIGDG
jgi:hypothetical protein